MLRDYEIHSEWIEVNERAIEKLQKARSEGGQILCVGTTSLRTIESVYRENQWKQAYRGTTRLYLYPGQEIHACDALLTNFHLPKSSLLVLVAALSGLNAIQEIYSAALKQSYRLFSFGDCMLLPNRSRL